MSSSQYKIFKKIERIKTPIPARTKKINTKMVYNDTHSFFGSTNSKERIILLKITVPMHLLQIVINSYSIRKIVVGS